MTKSRLTIETLEVMGHMTSDGLAFRDKSDAMAHELQREAGMVLRCAAIRGMHNQPDLWADLINGVMAVVREREKELGGEE